MAVCPHAGHPPPVSQWNGFLRVVRKQYKAELEEECVIWAVKYWLVLINTSIVYVRKADPRGPGSGCVCVCVKCSGNL